MRQPGIEPGSTAWKAAMLTTIPLTLTYQANEDLSSLYSLILGKAYQAKRSLP